MRVTQGVKAIVGLQARSLVLAISLGSLAAGSFRQSGPATNTLTYPRCVAMPEATDRLNKDKPSSWLEAQACSTNDSIDDVIKHFKGEVKTLPRIEVKNRMVLALMHNNWEVKEGTLEWPPAIFFVGDELKKLKPDVAIKTTLGVIPFSDSLIRVHLMSPFQGSSNKNEMSSGTLLTIIRERIPQEGTVADDQEKAYTGRDVTRTAWIKSKPEPNHPGGPGHQVVLKVILTSRGEVGTIRVVGDVFDQFTRASIEAARKIKFEPAIKDGRYVSVWVQLEYIFFP